MPLCRLLASFFFCCEQRRRCFSFSSLVNCLVAPSIWTRVVQSQYLFFLIDNILFFIVCSLVYTTSVRSWLRRRWLLPVLNYSRGGKFVNWVVTHFAGFFFPSDIDVDIYTCARRSANERSLRASTYKICTLHYCCCSLLRSICFRMQIHLLSCTDLSFFFFFHFLPGPIYFPLGRSFPIQQQQRRRR